jgi:chemotaxis protein CheX
VEQNMTQTLRDSVHLVADPKNLDASVDKVFRLMLGVARERVDGPLSSADESVTAVVGFLGILSGARAFACAAEAAMKVAVHLRVVEFSELDDTVKDGISEICNLLAGTWKGRVPELAANCGLFEVRRDKVATVQAALAAGTYNVPASAVAGKVVNALLGNTGK